MDYHGPEKWLEEHPSNSVECADCPQEIKQGDRYVMIGEYMYCPECAADKLNK